MLTGNTRPVDPANSAMPKPSAQSRTACGPNAPASVAR